MYKSNVCNGTGSLVTLPEMAQETSLGVSTIRKLATESGCFIKIGKCARIDKDKFLKYLRDVYTVME